MKSSKTGALLLGLPWTLTFAAFWLFPIAYSFIIGFTDLKLLSKEYHWVGLANYTALFADPAFLPALKNTLIFVVGTIPLTTILALGLALLVNREFKGRGLFRSGFFCRR